MPLHSSLGNKSETLSQKKKKKKNWNPYAMLLETKNGIAVVENGMVIPQNRYWYTHVHSSSSSRMVLARCCREGRTRSYSPMGIEFLFDKMKSSGDG